MASSDRRRRGSPPPRQGYPVATRPPGARGLARDLAGAPVGAGALNPRAAALNRDRPGIRSYSHIAEEGRRSFSVNKGETL